MVPIGLEIGERLKLLLAIFTLNLEKVCRKSVKFQNKSGCLSVWKVWEKSGILKISQEDCKK